MSPFKRFNRDKVINFLDKNRIYFIFLIVFITMSSIAPNFLNLFNMSTLLKGMCMNAMLACGFTIVVITGHFDLSIAAVLKLGIVLVIGLQPELGWELSILIAIISGSILGFINGILVTKLKIHSFIATLGTMIIIEGLVMIYSRGGSLSISDFTFSDWMESTVFFIFSPRVLITICIIVMVELFLTRTKYGKRLYMVGGNRETAWLAGIGTDNYVIMAFVGSGILASISGVLTAISLSAFVPSMGNDALIMVMAAVIIGGTKLSGGKGSVFKSMIAVLALTTLFNGLSGIGTPIEARLLVNGLVLAIVVLYESYVSYKNERIKGQRPNLLKELGK